jgi:CBS domain-containing protein
MATDSPTLVSEVMSTPLETISRSATVREAVEQMRGEDINGLFVPGSNPGIVTTTDVLDVVAAGDDIDGVTVEEVMTAPVERVTTDVEMTEAAAMMTTYGIKHLPVTDDHGDYVGMISSTDLAPELA